MLLLIATVLIVLWIAGLIGNIGGGLINLLLVIALVTFIWHMIRGHRHTV